ncbi:MAG: hypothetical protein Kow0090_05710 [Myxococcota bacterium]
MEIISSKISREVLYSSIESDIETIRYKVKVSENIPIAIERRRLPGESGKAFIFAVHGFAQNRHTWHLPQISFANYLAANGYEFISIDLRGTGLSRDLGAPPPVSLEDYRADVIGTLNFVLRKIVEGAPLFLFGHSLGGIVCFTVAPEFKRSLSGVVSFCAPYRFKEAFYLKFIPPYLLEKAAEVFESQADAPFHTRRFARHLAENLNLYNNPFFTLPFSSWETSNMEDDMLKSRLSEGFDTTSGPILAALVRFAVKNRIQIDGDGAPYDENFERLNLPLYICAADNDKLAPKETVEPAYANSLSEDKTYRLFGGHRDKASFGHIDIILGKASPKIVWPEILDWLDNRSGGG